MIDNKKIKNDLIFNFMLDMRKNKFEPLERAMMIQEYLNETQKSKRGLAQELGIPHTTLEGWLAWAKVTKEERDKLKKDGLNDSQIIDSLKCSRLNREERQNSNHYFNIELKNFIAKISSYEKRTKQDNETLTLIRSLQDKLNRIMMYMEKRRW